MPDGKKNLQSLTWSIKLKQLLNQWPLVTALIVVFMVIWTYSLYLNQPFQIKGSSGLVSGAAAEVLGEGYEGGANLERGQAVQIIYGVLNNLRLEDFKEPKDAKAIISWAKGREVLKGRHSGFCEDEPATKQECLVFLARSLGIMEELFTEERPVFSDDTVFDPWTRPQIEGLVIAQHLRISDIDDLGDLRKAITVSELEGLLVHIVTLKTQNIDYLEFVLLWLKDNPIYLLFALFFPIIKAILKGIELFVLAGDIWNRCEQARKEKKERENRTGTVCLAGLNGTGKTALKEQMITRGNSTWENPERYSTKEGYEEKFEYRPSNSTELFGVTVFDGPGDNKRVVRKFLDKPDRRNVILLLILAHTQRREGSKVVKSFLDRQSNAIEDLWSTIILDYSEKLNKVVVFINKKDLLPPGRLPAKSCIYKKHIELLKDAAKEAGVAIDFIEGSAVDGESIDELYNRMFPNFPISK